MSRQRNPKARDRSGAESTSRPRTRGRELVLGLLVLAAAVLPYLPALRGEFVYDDRHQIVGNVLIQDPGRLGEALRSDVWAFKGEREGAWSSYWRPVFVLWLVGNERLFGLGSTVGWHVALLAVHALVALLVLRLARTLGAAPEVAAAAAVLFAAHPGHAESVAWISGAPDPLATLFAIGSLLALSARLRGGGRWLSVAALAAAAAAMLTKEFAVVLPIVATCWVAELAPGEARDRWRRAIRTGAVFAGLAALYLLARHEVIGAAEVVKEWQRGPAIDLLSAPRVLLFYLRQTLWPVRIGPSYPLRVVTPEDSLLTAFVAPALLLAAAAIGLWLFVRRDRMARLGALLWLAPLLPALHVDTFHPEQIVHDRYLYLSLVGAAFVAVSAIRTLARRTSSARPEVASLAVAVVLALPLGWLAADASRTWTSELALWQRGVLVDPTSASSLVELGRARRAAGDLVGARAAIERAMSIFPAQQVRLAYAELLLDLRETAKAEAELRMLHGARPDDSDVAERFAILLQESGRSGEAESVLRETRERAPQRRCGLTANLAVVLYLRGQKGEALHELRQAAELVEAEPTENCRRSLLLLAELEAAAGRPAAARASLERLLEILAPLEDPGSAGLRDKARSALRALGG
ncbi:MAG: tetratricopeptide repeat protein [Holophagales bacterium]|nr:tetratricopeptide repeat protein [Holophagales bacterium]